MKYQTTTSPKRGRSLPKGEPVSKELAQVWVRLVRWTRRRGLVDWQRESRASRGHSLVLGLHFLTEIHSLSPLTGRIWLTVGRSSSRTLPFKAQKVMSNIAMLNRTFRNHMPQEERPPWWPIDRTIPSTRMCLMISSCISCKDKRGTPWIRRYIYLKVPLWYCRTMQSHSSFQEESNHMFQNPFIIRELQRRYKDWCWKILKLRKDQERSHQGSRFWRRRRTVSRSMPKTTWERSLNSESCQKSKKRHMTKKWSRIQIFSEQKQLLKL